MTVLQSDVVVVGAGPAGSATALFLARRGYDVTLLDRALFPRPKPCGEFLTPGAVVLLRDALGVLPSLLAGGATLLTREVIVPHGGRAFGGPTQALACPRLVTDDVLRRTARAAGVRVVEGFAARRILFDGDMVTGVSDGHTRYQAPVTVGADGTHSLLARTLGVVRPIRRLQRLALVGHFLGMTSADPADDAVTMHLPADRADACCGVGAPAGPDGARNVNIVVPFGEARALAGRHEDYFGERLRRSFPAVWAQMADAQRVGPLRSIGCFGHHTTRATHGGAVLVGDAATFINPFTGEGVFFALRGAQMAAQVVDAALTARNVGADALRPYDALRHRELLPRYRLCDLVQRVVHSPALLAWASARLRGSASLTELLLQAVGDQARPRDLYSWHGLRLALASFLAMHTENTVFMRGPLPRIFKLAADIQDWPQILPHYREVTVRERSDDGNRKVAEMACVRADFPLPGLQYPVRWRSVQVCDPQAGRIYFKHTGGLATGMWVVWKLEPDPWGRGTRVTIAHDLVYPVGLLNGWFARDLVGRDFVHAIAGRTLATIQGLVEGEPQR